MLNEMLVCNFEIVSLLLVPLLRVACECKIVLMALSLYKTKVDLHTHLLYLHLSVYLSFVTTFLVSDRDKKNVADNSRYVVLKEQLISNLALRHAKRGQLSQII